MINFKKIIYDIVVTMLCFAFVNVSASPVDDVAPAVPKVPCKRDGTDAVYYDQRQNGTDNYRISVDGVVIAVAPAESMLTALSAIDLEDLLDYADSSERPSSSTASQESEPAASSSNPVNKPEEIASAADSKPPSVPNKSVEEKRPKKKGLKSKLANLLLPLIRKYRQH